MLCCVSRKASARPSNENQRKHQKPVDSDCAGSSSGFSESSSASSGDFPSSGFSPTSSSSSSSSGFSSASPLSLFAFANSSSSGSDGSNCFDLSVDCLANSSNLPPEFNSAGASSSSSASSSFSFGAAYPSGPPKRLLTFSPSVSTVRNPLGENDNSLVEKDRSDKDEPPVLLPCAICARTFKPQSLEKHTRICERSAVKKRKPFDSAKQRIQGTDLAEFLPKETTPKRKVHQEEKPVAPIPSKAPSWKQTHDEFLRAIRAARGETIDGGGQRPAVAPNQVTVGVPTRPNEKGMCPTCNRQFSIKAYERHVAWCKEHATRVPITPATNIAKERLEARMKYRAPLLKNRRVTNREKYSPGSAVNLPSYSSKNSQPRPKESASTPNCNNKSENEATMGAGGTQNHQKATANARRSGQGREGISSGPMKSRLSDRSSRPAAEIESGPTRNPSPSPISPRINVDPRFSITRSNVASPLPTSRSLSNPESSRIASQECGGISRRIIPSDRKPIQLINIFNGPAHRPNIVSARSYGHPKVNDITINDQVIGMTVQRCGIDGNAKKVIQEELVTWKQIGQDKNHVKQTFLGSNAGENLEESPPEFQLAERMTLVKNYPIASEKSFAKRCIKKLNQTYLISESLDSKEDSSDIFGKNVRRSNVDKPRREVHCPGKLSSKKIFSDVGNLNWFNTNLNTNSLPLRRGKNRGDCEVDVSGAVNPAFLERAKLAPLDLEIISNDEVSEEGDTFTSGRGENSEKSSPKTCHKLRGKASRKVEAIGGYALTCEDSLDFSDLREANSIDLDKDNQFFERFKGSTVNIRRDQCFDPLPDTSPFAKTTQRDHSLLTEEETKINSASTAELDIERQPSVWSCNERDTRTKVYQESNEEQKVEVTERCQLLETLKSTSTLKLDSNEPRDVGFHDENNEIRERSSGSIEAVKKKINISEHSCHLLDTSRSAESISNTKNDLNGDEPVNFKFYNRDRMRGKYFSMGIENPNEKVVEMKNKEFVDTSKSQELIRKVWDTNNGKYSSKSVDNYKMKIIPYENRLLLDTSGYMKNSVTPTKKKLPKTRCKSNEACEKITSKSLDEVSCQFSSRLLLRDTNLETDHDTMALETSRSIKSGVTEIISDNKSLLKDTPQFSDDTELRTGKLLNDNSCGEKNDDSSINLIDSVSIEETLSVKMIDNNCTENLESNASKPVEKSSDKSVENIDSSHAKPVENSANSLVVEKVKNPAMIEPAKNYQRCGTYVIERAINPKAIGKHSVADEHLDEKPLHKRRRTEQNMANNQLEKKSISSETASRCLEETPRRDFKPEKNRRNVQDFTSASLGKSAIKLGSTECKIESIDRSDDEISEKYVNQNFHNDSDNNFLQDDATGGPTTAQKQLSSNELSNYDSGRKAFSDSVVPRQTISLIFPPTSQKERASKVSAEIRRKFKKNMSLVRRSTDTLISSVETSGTAIASSSSSGIVAPCEIESTPHVEEETIEKLDFATIETISPSKTSYCGFLPNICVNRRLTADNVHLNEKKSGNLHFWDKTRRSSTMKLINLDPPKCQQKRIENLERSNVRNLPPVFPASFRKERRRGSCKDYDPFLLAERQMNELLSDTCSDQSFTDSLGNRRISSSPPSHNYPLSHSSAFVKYPDAVTRSLNNSEKRVESLASPSELDDLTADFSSDSTETNSISREILADLEDSRASENNFSHDRKSKDSRDYILGRRVIIDKSKALGTNEIIEAPSRKNSQTNHKARKILEKITPKVVESPHVTRSSSLRANSAPKAPERKHNNNSSTITATNKINARSNPGSGLNNRNNNYASLSGSNMSLSSTVSSELEVKRSNSLFDGLASSFEDDVSDMYPSLRSLLKNDSLSISSPVQSDRLRNGQISDEELSSPDGYQKQQDHTKLSADSAYSSLNRKYSNHGRSTNDVAGRQTEDLPQHRRDGDAGSISSAKSRLPKFCHECGCKFPETAKFCCECGIKRLALS